MHMMQHQLMYCCCQFYFWLASLTVLLGHRILSLLFVCNACIVAKWHILPENCLYL